jgi:hypothetical protein
VNEEALECIRATKPGPTVVARALFVPHAAAYDAWAAYDPKAVPTIPQSELPPGHWNLFAQWVSRRWRQSIDADAKMFLGLDGAMLDASISAWSIKYRYDLGRPVSVIPALRAGQMIRSWAGPGQGTQLIRGESAFSIAKKLWEGG